ncbi:MAG: hypothetical protein R2731_19320 [Nocardioides sp.]
MASLLRVQQRQAVSTVRGKAGSIARFFDFLQVRYQGDIHALTGVVVDQPIDEFNRPAKTGYGAGRVPPPTEDVEALFTGWRASLPEARKYLPAARDYVVASLWRRVGLRINETAMLDIRDWRPTSARSASCTSGSGRAPTVAAPRHDWCPASTRPTSCSPGG